MNLQDSVYYKAYEDFATEIWSGLFDTEIEDTCFSFALDFFSRGGSFGANKRRELQVAYMDGLYSTKKQVDILKRAEHIVPTENFMIEKILANLCNIYSQPVSRKWTNGGERQIDLLSKIQYDDVLNTIHKRAKFNGNMLVFVGWDGEKIKIQDFGNGWYKWKNKGTQEEPIWELWVAIVEEKSQNKIAYDVRDIHNGREWFYHVWSNESYKLVNKQKQVIKEIPNKYKVIPFVEVDFPGLNKYDYYDNSGGMWGLLEAQLQVNMLQFASLTNAQYSATSILWLDNIQLEDESSFGLGKILITKTDVDDPDKQIEFVNAVGNFTELDDYRNNLIKATYKNYGMPSAMVNEGGVMSGEALKIDRIELEEQRKNDIKIMEYYEKEISKLIDIISAREGNAYNLGEYSITYNELEVIGDPEKNYNLSKVKFNDNVISIYDHLRDIGYIGEDFELEEILKQIKEVNNEFRELNRPSSTTVRDGQSSITSEPTQTGSDVSTNGIEEIRADREEN
jgi:hypothetical protein